MILSSLHDRSGQAGFGYIPASELNPPIIERLKKYIQIGNGTDTGDKLPPTPFLPKCVWESGFAYVEISKPDGDSVYDLWSRESLALNMAQAQESVDDQKIIEEASPYITVLFANPVALGDNTKVCGLAGSSIDKRKPSWIKFIKGVLTKLGVCVTQCQVETSDPILKPHRSSIGLLGGHVGLYEEAPNFQEWYLLPICSDHNQKTFDFPQWMTPNPDALLIHIPPHPQPIQDATSHVSQVFQFNPSFVYESDQVHFNESYTKANYIGSMFDVIHVNTMGFFLYSHEFGIDKSILFFKTVKEKVFAWSIQSNGYCLTNFDSIDINEEPCEWSGHYVSGQWASFDIDSMWHVQYGWSGPVIRTVGETWLQSGKLISVNPYVGLIKTKDAFGSYYDYGFLVRDIVRDRIITWYTGDTSLDGLGFRIWQRA